MEFQIEIIAVKQETKPTAKGSYQQLDVAYKRLDTGKIEGKKVMSFSNKDVFATLSAATNGNIFTVDSVKNEKTSYWDWVKVTASGGGSSQSSTSSSSRGTSSPKSTYETPSERALRQRMIVRQSSLANAIQTLSVNPGKDKLQIDEVIKVAENYFNWVMDTSQPSIPNLDIGSMDDDIPM